MSFQTDVEDLVGSQSDTAALTVWLTDGGRMVVDYLANKKSDKLEIYATTKTDAGSGIAITSGRPISAHKSNYRARRIHVDTKAQAADSGSIYYAVATDPVWYIDQTRGYVLPSGGTIRWVGYPTVAYSDSSISNFPPEGYEAVIYHAAIQSQIRNITDLIRTTMNGISFTAPTNVTPPAAPSFTWTDATGATVQLSSVSINKTLSFTPPVFGGSYTNADTALGNQDVELAQGYLNKTSNQLNQYQTDLQNQLAQFNKDAKQYDNELQEAIAQAQIDSQRVLEQARLTQDLNLQNELYDYKQDVDEYSAKLGKYAQDVQDYSAQVNEEISRIQILTGKYTSEYQGMFALLKELREEFKKIMETL